MHSINEARLGIGEDGLEDIAGSLCGATSMQQKTQDKCILQLFFVRFLPKNRMSSPKTT
jgi:hypothetical protein